jgi:acetyltransferase-like isoleucine patch superfamily enzyme
VAFLTELQLQALRFKRLGRHVKVSDKAAIYNADQIELGDHVRIDDFCVVSGRVVFGRNVHVAVFCNVAGGTEGVELGDFAGLAYACHVFSQSDDYSGQTLTNPTIPSEFKNETKAKVRIGRHCIIGTRSIVMPGVEVSQGCAIGAMSMVTQSTEPWSIYFGVPATRQGAREKGLLTLEREYLDKYGTLPAISGVAK